MLTILTLFQEGPLETTNYMLAGYLVIFGVMAIYLGSLFLRSRNLKKDWELLNEMDEQK